MASPTPRAFVALNSTGTSGSLTEPTGTVSGDLVVIFINLQGVTGNSVATPASGATPIDSVQSATWNLFSYWYISTGSAQTWSWSSATATNFSWVAASFAPAQVNIAAPIDGHGGLFTGSSTVNLPTPSITNTFNNDIVLSAAMTSGTNTWTQPTGWSVGNLGGSETTRRSGIAYLNETTARTVSGETWTQSTTGSAGCLKVAVRSPLTIVTLTGISSAVALGSASVRGTTALTGLASAGALGTPTARGTASLTGLASAQAFGALATRASTSITDIATAQAVGVPTPVLILPATGIASAGALGTPTVSGFAAALTGIGSREAFGGVVTYIVIPPIGNIASAAALGIPTLSGITRLTPVQVGEVFGGLRTLNTVTVQQWVDTLEAFGLLHLFEIIRTLPAIYWVPDISSFTALVIQSPVSVSTTSGNLSSIEQSNGPVYCALDPEPQLFTQVRLDFIG